VAAITLSGIPQGSAVVIDSFTLRGGTGAGITVDGSPGTIIENCTFESNPGDGVSFTASNGSLLFNNLLFNNSGAGVRALGTDGLWVFNNTIYNNTGTGIAIGSDQDASPDAVVENNIINSNGSFGIAVAANSTGGYHGDYNLNSDGYAAGTPPGPDDITADLSAMSLFISPTATPPDLHLAPGSPAVGAGDPATLADLGNLLQNQVGVLSSLQSGTTQTDGTLDCQFADLGYHYRVDQICGVPTPTPTAAPTRSKKKTATPTP
jgi:parallel beta-helix repeat protein